MKTLQTIAKSTLAIAFMFAFSAALMGQSRLTVSNRTSQPIVVSYVASVFGQQTQQSTSLDPMYFGFSEFTDDQVCPRSTVTISYNGKSFAYPMDGQAHKTIIFDGVDPIPPQPPAKADFKLTVKNYSDLDLSFVSNGNGNRPYRHSVNRNGNEVFRLPKYSKVALAHGQDNYEFVLNADSELIIHDGGMLLDGKKLQPENDSQLMNIKIDNASRERMLVKYFNNRGFESMMQLEPNSSKEFDAAKGRQIYVRTANNEYDVDHVVSDSKIVASDHHLYVNGKEFFPQQAADSLQKFGIEGHIHADGGFKVTRVLNNSIADRKGFGLDMIIVNVSGRNVQNINELRTAFDNAFADGQIQLQIYNERSQEMTSRVEQL